ncbi:hypothetical protein F2P81_017815 [Scophthalmus maximus]|uniref:Uncharacterized protein n=1 Tax=Scophthalmus maximus TaxID=52904 RepID=A0A6A4SAL5_SCOMX|nr:hypothetical protein F2P81_017815 [Scophthalmus maximus]
MRQANRESSSESTDANRVRPKPGANSGEGLRARRAQFRPESWSVSLANIAAVADAKRTASLACSLFAANSSSGRSEATTRFVLFGVTAPNSNNKKLTANS